MFKAQSLAFVLLYHPTETKLKFNLKFTDYLPITSL